MNDIPMQVLMTLKKWLAPALLLPFFLLSLTAGAAARTETFWVADMQGNRHTEVTADLVFDGRFSRIWLDRDDRERVGASVIATIARALDSATPAGSRDPGRGVIENVRAVFGDSPARYRISGREDILLVDLPDQIDGMTTLGYFHTKDQHPASRSKYSNERNMLYIDSREGLRNMERMIGTIAHEYQHLIHFGHNPDSEIFFNEGCSELASVLTGYVHSNSFFLSDPNVPLLRWSMEDPDDAQADYERAMSLLIYLHEQFGDRFVTEFVDSRKKGLDRIEDALGNSGHADLSGGWQRVLVGFAVANALQQEGEGAFGYRRALDESGADPQSFTIGDLPDDTPLFSRTLAPYGASYHEFDQPGALRLAVEGEGDFMALAIVEGKGRTRIIQLEPGEETRILDGEQAADRVMLVLQSLSRRSADLRWSASTDRSGAIASTPVQSTADENLRLMEITPNPVVRTGIIAFRTRVAGDLTVDLYSRSGDRIASLVDGMAVEAGRFQVSFDGTRIPAGHYIVRLKVGSLSTTGQMIIQR